jgi:DNA-binding transcriptional regulator LsrR (DeoR family)
VGDLVAGYQAGRTVRQLAARFQIHRATVSEHLERHGVARRVCKPQLVGPDVATAHLLYESGRSLAQVGEQYGVHRETVRRAFKKAGLEVRPRA